VKAASARGAYAALFDRPRNLMPHQRREAVARRHTGEEVGLTCTAESSDAASCYERQW
jgi:hypothetical protein